MQVDLFRMERTQCLYENEVRFNLSESGVLPLSIEELLPDADARAELLRAPLKYPASTGRESLRRSIAGFYGCDDPAMVTVTNGGSEANYAVLWSLVGPGDRVAFMLPNYLQGQGIARAYGDRVDPYRLRMQPIEEGGWRWALDLDSLREAVGPGTRAIVVTNPNNPTGAVLTETEMDAIVDAAASVGAWIVADEIYRGAEVDGAPLTPTFHGRYERVAVTAGLSKAFGMPGLRIGWVLAPRDLVADVCRHHDYLTLTPGLLSDTLADAAMRVGTRQRILERTRRIIDEHLPVLEGWIAGHGGLFDYAPPRAGAIATLRYRLPIASEELFDRLRLEHSVLITPGEHFGIGDYLRIGFGYDLDGLRAGLAEIDALLGELSR